MNALISAWNLLCGREASKDEITVSAWVPKRLFRPGQEVGNTQCAQGTLVRDGFTLVASDGACPNQQQESRLRRAGCGLFYGDNHPLNCSFAPATACQTSTRAEIRAAARWIHWVWGNQELLTDNKTVLLGFSNLAAFGEHRMSCHLDLWQRIQKDWERHSPQYRLKVTKVTGHSTVAQCQGDAQLLLHKRYNDAADKLAVAGAIGNQLPPDLVKHHQHEAQRIRCLQHTLVRLHLARDAAIKTQGLGKVVKPPKPPAQQENPPDDADPAMAAQQAAFPGFAWRASEGVHHTCFWGKIPDDQERGQQKAGARDLRWRYPERLFAPLIWYFRQLKWPQTGDLNARRGEHVTWLELALDFQASTHIELCAADADGAKELAGKRAIFFASAARRVSVICQDALAPVDPFPNNLARSLAPLGLPNAGGFPMRPLFLRPDVVNRILYQAALENLQTNCKLAFIPKFGQLGDALWSPHVALELARPRYRLKVKTRAADVQSNRPEVLRQPSNVQEVREQIPWDASQPYYVPGLRKLQVSREQKRLLHNRDADGKGWHRLAPFYGAEGNGDAELVCVKCHQRTDFNGWKRKWQQRHCGGASGEAHQEVAVAQGTLNWRKRRVRQHNETADANHLHLIAEPQAHDGRIRCTRPRCGAHLAWCQARTFFAQPCPG